MEVILEKLLKFIYIFLGILFFFIGLIGVVLPILPTTPFVLLASFFITKGSDRINNRFKKTKLYKNYVLAFRTNKLTFKQKLKIVITADLMLLISGILINNLHVRIFLFILGLTKTIIIFRLKSNSEIITKENL